MSGRAVWLTWKMHRFEVLVAIALLTLVGVSAWVVASHLNAITVGPGCWPQWQGDGGHLNACQQLVSRWLDVNEHEAGQLTGFLGYLPALVGAIVGVPIVARRWRCGRSRSRGRSRASGGAGCCRGSGRCSSSRPWVACWSAS